MGKAIELKKNDGFLHEHGTFRLEEDYTGSYFTVNHGLGVKPKFVVVGIEDTNELFVDSLLGQVHFINASFGGDGAHTNVVVLGYVNSRLERTPAIPTTAYCNGVRDRLTNTSFVIASNGRYFLSSAYTYTYDVYWWED